MKTNPENIPAHIYDLAERFRFADLGEQDRKNVLEYVDENTYNDLHMAAVAIRQSIVKTPAPGKNQRRQQLLTVFDAHNEKRPVVIPLWKQPVALWKVAAVVVLLLTGWTSVFIGMKKEPEKNLVASVDTVYVTKEVPSEPVKIHDTVYVERYKKNDEKKAVPHINPVSPANGTMTPVQTDFINAAGVESLNNRPNQPKGNSMKDDTLLKKYSFVTM